MSFASSWTCNFSFKATSLNRLMLNSLREIFNHYFTSQENVLLCPISLSRSICPFLQLYIFAKSILCCWEYRALYIWIESSSMYLMAFFHFGNLTSSQFYFIFLLMISTSSFLVDFLTHFLPGTMKL